MNHVRAGDFTHKLSITTQALGKVVVNRSWESLDATVAGRRFHFVNAQLEAYDAKTRLQQAQQLVAGALRSRLRTILVGDLNSGPNLPKPEDRPPFQAIAAGGFVEAPTAKPTAASMTI